MGQFMKASDLVSPYENIVIGNFLYGLGLAIGRRAGGDAPIASINLTQQTPLDPALGDVMVRFPGVLRLIEFKRSSSVSKKEDDKLAALRVVLTRCTHLDAVSRTIHWYVKSMPTAADTDVPIRVCPYLDMDVGAAQTTLAAFSNEFAMLAFAPRSDEPTQELIAEYIDCLAKMANSGTSSGGAMIVCVSPAGGVSYVALSDLRQISMNMNRFLSRQQDVARAIEIAHEHEHQIGNSLKPAHERKRERSNDMER